MSDEEEDIFPVIQCQGCLHNICGAPMPKFGNVEAFVSGEIKLIDVKAYFYLQEEGYNIQFECLKCLSCKECNQEYTERGAGLHFAVRVYKHLS